MIHTKYEPLNYIKKKRNGKREICETSFFHIPGFSGYMINKRGTLKDLTQSPAKIISDYDMKTKGALIYDDKRKLCRVDAVFLLSQMAYGPNLFPLLPIENDLLLSDRFTSEDIKVDLLLCYNSFKMISYYEIQIYGVIFRQYRYTPLYISRYGNVFNAATGMILKIYQKDGYYSLTPYYGGYRIQRMVYETWKDYIGENRVIDHINCRPWDNFDENLDSVTIRENTRRAIINSCKSYIMDWDTANKMCKDLAFPNPISPQQASKKYGVPIHVPRFIVQGLTWKEIAEENNLVYPDYNLRQHSEVTSDMISDAKSGMSIDSFAEKYKFGGRKLQCMYKSSLSAKK